MICRRLLRVGLYRVSILMKVCWWLRFVVLRLMMRLLMVVVIIIRVGGRRLGLGVLFVGVICGWLVRVIRVLMLLVVLRRSRIIGMLWLGHINMLFRRVLGLV